MSKDDQKGADGSSVGCHAEAVVDWVLQRGYQRVALQLPDDLLAHATAYAAAIEAKLTPSHTVAVLADTAFNAEAVDEVAAQHMNADCVVHYGPASLATGASLPTLFVLPSAPLDLPSITSDVAKEFSDRTEPQCEQPITVVILEQPYLHYRQELLQQLKQINQVQGHVILADVAASGQGTILIAGRRQDVASSTAPDINGNAAQHISIAGYHWQLPPGVQTNTCTHVWIGSAESSALQALQLVLSQSSWLVCSRAAPGQQAPCTWTCTWTCSWGLSPATHTLVRRRLFLVEKARNASIIGILVGTLAVRGLVTALSELRRLCHQAGKKSYTVLVGKPNPHKLANFPEVEVWVQLSDPLGFILDSKPYLAPLITPYEALSALTEEPLPEVLQLGDLTDLTAHLQAQRDVADNTVASSTQELTVLTTGLQLSVHQGGPGRQQVTAHSGAEYLALKRAYQGLEAPVAGATPKAPAPAVEGRAGRAAGYSQEGQGEH